MLATCILVAKKIFCNLLQMDATGKHYKINNFICGLIYDFDLIVNCDESTSDQKGLIVRYLYLLRVATRVAYLTQIC